MSSRVGFGRAIVVAIRTGAGAVLWTGSVVALGACIVLGLLADKVAGRRF